MKNTQTAQKFSNSTMDMSSN